MSLLSCGKDPQSYSWGNVHKAMESYKQNADISARLYA